MLKKRIIPKFLIRQGRLVKGVRFHENFREAGNPVSTAKVYDAYGVDELLFVDIDATRQQRDPDYALIAKLAAECRMPLAYGGGVSTVEQFERLVSLGVEKVSASAAAVADLGLVSAAAERVGGQSVVVVIDVRKKGKGFEVFTHNGTKATGLDAVEFARRAEAAGAGEIVINSIDRDGQMKGYDLDLVRAVRGAVTRPLTVLGGAGTLADMAGLVKEFGIIGAAAGSLFVFKGVYRAVLINYPARADKDQLVAAAVH
jgi:cyclase